MRLQTQLPQVELFAASSGAQSARVHTVDQRTVHLHSTVDPAAESEYYDNVNLWGDVVILLGTGLGYHLDRFFDSASPKTIVIACDLFPRCCELAAEQLHLDKLTHYSLSGPGAPQEAAGIEIPPNATVQVVRHPASCAIDPVYYDSILEHILRNQHPTDSRTPAARKKIMLLNSSFFVENELGHAIESESDCELRCFDYRKASPGIGFESCCNRELESFRPDCIISVNMNGFDGNGILAAAARHRRCTTAIWFVDDPRPILLNRSKQISDSMIAFCWEKKYLPLLHAAGFAQAHYLPLAADLGDTSPPPQTGEPQDALSFCATTMGGEFLDSLRQKFLWSSDLEPLVDQGVKTVLAHPELAAKTIALLSARELATQLPFDDPRNITWLSSYIIHCASLKKRTTLISGIADCAPVVYGDRLNWLHYCGPTLNARDPVDYPLGAHRVYASSAINLNSTSCQMPTAVNQRLFDIPCAGGFLLTDSQQDALELFEPEKEIIIYRSPEHLKELIKQYAADPGARQSVIAAACKRIRAHHTYGHRLGTLLKACGLRGNAA